jgi:hypothetical protein
VNLNRAFMVYLSIIHKMDGVIYAEEFAAAGMNEDEITETVKAWNRWNSQMFYVDQGNNFVVHEGKTLMTIAQWIGNIKTLGWGRFSTRFKKDRFVFVVQLYYGGEELAKRVIAEFKPPNIYTEEIIYGLDSDSVLI